MPIPMFHSDERERNWDFQIAENWYHMKQGMGVKFITVKFSACPALYAGVIFLESRGDRI